MITMMFYVKVIIYKNKHIQKILLVSLGSFTPKELLKHIKNNFENKQ